MRKHIFQISLCAVVMLGLASCSAARRAEQERKHKEQTERLDQDKKKFEQQNPQVR
jgi:hypothetical protein